MLLNMRDWHERDVDVLDVLLDPRNVRLVQASEPPQPLIINDLFQNAKALDLVQAIARLGYLTHEVPIVLERGPDLVVVEGNRRLAALKAIQNPYLVPAYSANIKRYVEEISESDREDLRTIIVKVAPGQTEADQLIAALHTSNPRVPWGPDRQAAFFEAQVEAGRTLDELVGLFPTVDVRKFVVRAKALHLFKSVPYSRDELTRAVNDDRKVKVSILERLYEYEPFQKLAGIKVSEREATAEIVGNRRRFYAVAEKVVDDIVFGKRLNTRTLNRQESASYQSYMRELEHFVERLPKSRGGQGVKRSADGNDATSLTETKTNSASDSDVSSGSGPSASTGKGQGVDKAETSAGGASASKSTTHTMKRLDITGLAISPGMANSAIPAILQEIGALNIETFPNATFDLLRTLLEKSIKMYATTLSIKIESQVTVRGHVTLDHCLEWLEMRARNEGERQVAGLIRKVKNGQLADYVATADHLNAINHNPLVSATATEVRTAWNSAKRVLEWVLKP